jgi:hypothetical protein
MADFIQPFDLKTLFVDYFLGSMELFVFGFVLIFSFVCAKYGMSNRLYLTLLVVSLILVSFLTGISGIYVLVIVFLGFIIFSAIAKLVS